MSTTRFREGKISFKVCLWITLLLLCLGFLLIGLKSCAAQYEEHVEGAAWMPTGASAGAFACGETFLLGPPVTLCEFSISEADFRVYAEKQTWPLGEITQETLVPRYLESRVRREDFPQTDEGDELFRRAKYAVITSGLIHEWRYQDQARILAFDRDRKRAYVVFQSR